MSGRQRETKRCTIHIAFRTPFHSDRDDTDDDDDVDDDDDDDGDDNDGDNDGDGATPSSAGRRDQHTRGVCARERKSLNANAPK